MAILKSFPPRRLVARAIPAAVVLNLTPAYPRGLRWSPPARQSCALGVFADASRPGTVDLGSWPTIRRLRRVEVDFARIFPPGTPPSAARGASSLTLNLFPDVCLTAARDQATDLAAGKVQWVGRLEGTSEGRVILIIEDALMVGTVTFEGKVFRISYVGDGVDAVVDMDPSTFPRD